MTISSRIRKISEMLDKKFYEGSIGYIDYHEMSNAIDDLYTDVMKSEQETKKVPDGYISLEKLRGLNKRPVYLIVFCDDGREICKWAQIGFYQCNPQKVYIDYIDYIGGNSGNVRSVDTYGKDWFCYMENPFNEI